jgi:GTP cyclohydrolase I
MTLIAPPTPARVDIDAVETLYRQLIVALGEDPDREGLRDTPRRAASWWREFLEHDPGRVDTAFEQPPGGEQFVIVHGIGTWSLCEHHLLPFRIRATIGYLPAGRVLGLSKLARVTAEHAHRLQLQERLTADIAGALRRLTGSEDVGVIVHGEHLCMSMRGVRAEAARTITISLTGRLRTDATLTASLHTAAQGAAR